jgi:hypothetical protein
VRCSIGKFIGAKPHPATMIRSVKTMGQVSKLRNSVTTTPQQTSSEIFQPLQYVMWVSLRLFQLTASIVLQEYQYTSHRSSAATGNTILLAVSAIKPSLCALWVRRLTCILRGRHFESLSSSRHACNRFLVVLFKCWLLPN